jgi:hypothetical protein
LHGAHPLQSFTWEISPNAKRELDRLGRLLDFRHGGKGFASDEVPGMLEADRAETDAQYERFLLEQFQRKDVRAAASDLLTQNAPPGLLLRLQQPPKTPPEARSLARDVDQATGVPVFDYLAPYFSYRYVNFFELLDPAAAS